MNNKININPSSTKWLEKDDRVVADYFCDLGFRSLKQILDMRVFDLMNMQGLNAVRVEEVIICLYKWLNPNTAIDEAIYNGMMSQPFLYAKQYGLATRTDDEKMIGARIDAVIPELRLAFAFSQKGTDREAKVAEVLHFLCKAKRIQLFVIWQKDPIALATEIKQAFAKANLFINSDSQRDVAHLRKRYFAQKNNGN